MKLSELKPAKGSTKNSKRIGRGQGSGRGGTSTRGHKGYKSRSGYSNKRNFEGGQTPLQRRLPKVGFKPINRVPYVPISLARLQSISEKYGLSDLTFEKLVELKIVRKNDKIKLLGNGELSSTVNVSVHATSETGKKGVENAGGSVTIL